MELPEEVKRLIRLFAWEPTPSAQAFRKAFEGGAVVERKVPARCLGCHRKLGKAYRKWVFEEDGRVLMEFCTNEGFCEGCCWDQKYSPSDRRRIQSQMCAFVR